MFSKDDLQAIADHANTIESGFIRLSDSQDLSELCEAIRFSGEQIRQGLGMVATAIERLRD